MHTNQDYVYSYQGGRRCPQRVGKMNAAWPPNVHEFSDNFTSVRAGTGVFGEADPPSKGTTHSALSYLTTINMNKQQTRTTITFLLRSGLLFALALSAAALMPPALGQRKIGQKRLINAQARWVWQNPLPQGNTLYSGSFTDANTGTATGDNGTIIRTTDGGNNWIIQSSGTTNTLYGVSFTDVNLGTAVGAAGTILRTTDGGNTWSSQTSGTTNGLLAVSFTDANTGTAVGEN